MPPLSKKTSVGRFSFLSEDGCVRKVTGLLLPALVFPLLMLAHSHAASPTTDDILFIHHSVGQDWLDNGLRNALIAKSYIDEVNEITYGDSVSPDTGRPASLDPPAGDHTDMCHWILWFNDYLQAMKRYDCANGTNKIIMFKSCFPNSAISENGTEPGDPFASTQTLVNYKAIYRHPNGPGRTYSYNSRVYKPLEDIFAANPGTLFIAVTAPSQIPSETCNNWADRARVFDNWLKTTWLNSYNAAHPHLRNVAVFDFFDVLAYANSDTRIENYTPADGSPAGNYPVRNMTKSQYRTGDSHPNVLADQTATVVFATSPSNFMDAAWNRWRMSASRARWTLFR
jgi:hypothetical protein